MNYARQANGALKDAIDSKEPMSKVWVFLVSAVVYALLDISEAVMTLARNTR